MFLSYLRALRGRCESDNLGDGQGMEVAKREWTNMSNLNRREKHDGE
jgi:hypothetical protein